MPPILQPICEASLDLSQVPIHWDRWVHLIASAYSGHTSAINVLARFGSAARGDPLYEVGVVIGRLLRTVFLADYFVNPAFRRELLRVLNRGEATNALKRLIYTGRVANYQAKSEDEMQAVADAYRAAKYAWHIQLSRRAPRSDPAAILGTPKTSGFGAINLRW